MRKFEKLSRKYKYQVRQKYQQDPFAFLVLWSLFFSAVFLIFAFRGLIAATFMHKIGVSNEILLNDTASTTDNATDNSANTVDNQTNPSADNTATPSNNTSNNTTDNSVNNSANEVQNTAQ